MAPEKEIEASESGQQPVAEQPIAQQNAADVSDQQPDAQQPDPVQPSTFPKFMSLPAEIQQKIFLDAVNEPSIHVVKAHRKEQEGQQKWSLSFTPVVKSQDKSGYRLVKDIRAVNQAAQEAIRVFEQVVEREGDLFRLPFKALRAHVDAANDLVLIDIPGRKKFGTFHPDYQFLNPTFSTFDDVHVAATFPTVQKVAINWRDRDDASHMFNVNFRCTEDPTLQGSSHATHFCWRMCPEEVCGLLNCFPKLREFYLIYEPSRYWQEKEMIEIYAKNYHTRKSNRSPHHTQPNLPPHPSPYTPTNSFMTTPPSSPQPY
jgi:hypothetical protein